MRIFSIVDKMCLGADQMLRALWGHAKTTARHYPAEHIPDAPLSSEQRKQCAALMRINHAGEVCAQALYHGQGVATRNKALCQHMQQAAIEEGDHLVWCSKRLSELGSHTSYLNPFWYIGSFAIGLTAGMMGDRWSLGFVAETESQVVKHLKKHLTLLPQQDQRSYQVLQQMQVDEAMHREDAIATGAAPLPNGIKKLMSLASKVMVKVAYYI